MIHADVLVVLLNQCRTLTAFAFDHSCFIDCDLLNFPATKEVLEPFKGSLRYLSLDITVHGDLSAEQGWKSLGSLVEFRCSSLNVRSLEVSYLDGLYNFPAFTMISQLNGHIKH